MSQAADISGIDALFNQVCFVCDTCSAHIKRGARGRKPKPPTCYACRRRAAAKRKARPAIACHRCQSPFPSGTSGKVKWCSSCKPIVVEEYQRQWQKEYILPAPKPEQKRCLNCEAAFTPINNSKHILYCSEGCRRAVDWARRNAQRKLAGSPHKIDRVSVYRILSRDGWRCQFCKVETPRKLRGTFEPNAPEVDHILPLSLGGSHEESNLQCLCRRCNMAKGARPMGQHRLL